MTLGQAIALLLLLLTAWAGYLRFRDVLYPPVLQSGVWLVILGLYLLNQDQFVPISPLAYGVVVGTALAFSAGAFVAVIGHRVVRQPLRDLVFAPKPWYASLLFWIALIGLVPFLRAALALGATGPFDNFYMNLRFNATNAEVDTAGGAFGVASYFLPVSYVSVFVQTLFEGYRRHRLTYFVSLAVALAYAFLFTGRTNFLVLVVTLAGILLITRRIPVTRTALVGTLVFGAVFTGIGFLTGKAGQDQSSLAAQVRGVYDVVMLYAVGALPAFDAFIHGGHEWGWGAYTFRTPLAVLSHLGVPVGVVPLIQEYEFVPFPTNVYTVYHPYFADFGYAGLVVFPFLLGCLHGYLYRRATRGHLPSVLLYALSLFPLMMQFFQDQYFSLLSMWVQYVVLIFVFFYRIRLVAPALSSAARCLPSTSSS